MAKTDKLDEVLDTVLFIKGRVAAVETDLHSFREEVNHFREEMNGKLNGIGNRNDDIVDKNKALDVRTTKLETKVFGRK